MPVFSSSELIDELQQQTEIFLNKATSDWGLLPPAVLQLPPAQGKWSAIQCLEHLNSYGRYYLPAIKKAFDKAEITQSRNELVFVSGWLGNYFTNLMKPGTAGVNKKMKSPRNHVPSATLDCAQVLAEFVKQQREMLQLLEQSRTTNLNKTRVPISIAPFLKLKLGDVFRFLNAHNERHVLQAENAIEFQTLKGIDKASLEEVSYQ